MLNRRETETFFHELYLHDFVPRSFPPMHVIDDVVDSLISPTEVKNSIFVKKNDKAAGPDGFSS